MLCLTRYLGEMIGDLIRPCNRVWRFYLIVREIVEIVTCPYFVKGTDLYLRTLIQEHHEMYVEITGENLKPKHHRMLYFPEILRRNGPLVDVTALLSERKHRMGKMYAHIMNSRIDLPLSVSIKVQLQLCYQLMSFECEPCSVFTGVKKSLITCLESYQQFHALLPFNLLDTISTAQCVEINGTSYRKGMVVVLGLNDMLPEFGGIAHIVLQNDAVKFVIRKKITIDYRNHFCTYAVKDTNEFVYLSQSDFLSHVPLWQRTAVDDGEPVVSMKFAL